MFLSKSKPNNINMRLSSQIKNEVKPEQVNNEVKSEQVAHLRPGVFIFFDDLFPALKLVFFSCIFSRYIQIKDLSLEGLAKESCFIFFACIFVVLPISSPYTALAASVFLSHFFLYSVYIVLCCFSEGRTLKKRDSSFLINKFLKLKYDFSINDTDITQENSRKYLRIFLFLIEALNIIVLSFLLIYFRNYPFNLLDPVLVAIYMIILALILIRILYIFTDKIFNKVGKFYGKKDS